MSQLHPDCLSDVNENNKVNNDIELSILELCNDASLWVLRPDQSPLLNWMRLARLNHRGCWVFLVHLSLMTGQWSGWRGNRTGKFSTLLGLLWLREAVIYLQSNNYSLLSFNATVQYTDFVQQLHRLRLLVTFHFFQQRVALTVTEL